MAKSTTKTTPASSAPTSGQEAKKVSTKIGVVESDKRAKTRKVVIHFKKVHSKYGKIMTGRTVIHIHDENNDSHLGDTVEIKPCRPISRTKRWTLVRIVEKSTRVELIQA